MAGKSFAFHKLTPESLYWLGWIATDGCVYWHKKDGWRISLKLQEADKSLVERFALFIGAKPPTQVKSNKQWRADLNSPIMGAKLIEYGITPRKSHTLMVANELARSPYFWRGAFEGDGCFRENKQGDLIVQLTSASKSFLKQFQIFYPNCTLLADRACWRAICCCSNARRLLAILYDGTYQELGLERKLHLPKKWGRMF